MLEKEGKGKRGKGKTTKEWEEEKEGLVKSWDPDVFSGSLV